MADVEEQLKDKLNIFERMLDNVSSTDERLDLIAKILLQGIIVARPSLGYYEMGVPHYNVRKYDLTTAKTKEDPQVVELSGDALTFYSSGSLEGIEVALDGQTNDWIPVAEFGNPLAYPGRFQKFFLSWTTQADKFLRVIIGREAGASAATSVTVTSGRKVSTATNTAVSVGAASTAILSANSTRLFAILVNDSDEEIYLALGDTAVMNEGIRLNASGGSFEINSNNLYTGAITAICTSGGKVLTVVEG